MPHWKPPLRINASCSGESSSSEGAMPSMVVTERPSTMIAGSKHPDMSVPATRMLHAPQTPMLQPIFVPVRPMSSRSKSTMRTSGPTDRSTVFPLSSNDIW